MPASSSSHGSSFRSAKSADVCVASVKAACASRLRELARSPMHSIRVRTVEGQPLHGMRDGLVELAKRIARHSSHRPSRTARSMRSSAALMARLAWKYRTRSSCSPSACGSAS